MRRKECFKCLRKITPNNYARHVKACGKPKPAQIQVKEEWKQSNGLYKCPFCLKSYRLKGIGGHIWRYHTEEGKGFDPNRGFRGGTRVAWSQGLTKETEPLLEECSKRMIQGYKTGRYKKTFLGRAHTEETKNKISKFQLAFLEANPDKVLYRQFHSSQESYPEKRFRKALEKAQITGWVQNYAAGIYEYDFAFVDLKLDVEIDGDTHLKPGVKQKDQRRDAWSRSQGWAVLRFTAKEVKHNLDQVISRLQQKLKELQALSTLTYLVSTCIIV